MIRSTLMLCADSVITDTESNSLSAINIIEEISAISFPAVLPRLAVLNLLERDEADAAEIDCALAINLDGDTIFSRELDVRFLDKFKCRSIVFLSGVSIPRLGTLNVTLSHAGNILARYEAQVQPGLGHGNSE